MECEGCIPVGFVTAVTVKNRNTVTCESERRNPTGHLIRIFRKSTGCSSVLEEDWLWIPYIWATLKQWQMKMI